MTARTPPKNVVVIGGAYGGGRAAQVIAKGLPEGWRVILVDRNSHANHVYILPRLTVLPGHEHKAFIPYRNVFMLDQPHPHLFLNCHVLSLTTGTVKLSKSYPEHGIVDGVLEFNYLVYALGSTLPRPLDLWGTDTCGIIANPQPENQDLIYRGEKPQAIEWLTKNHKVIEDASSVLIVGGGALGVQFATDIAAIHPGKRVTLLHSRERFLPKFNEEMHQEVLSTTEKLGVDVILGERLDMKSVEEKPPKRNGSGQRVVRTVKGRELAADLLMLCTGQKANTHLLREMDNATVNADTHLAHVLRTLQLGVIKMPSSADKSLDVALNGLTLDNAEAKQPLEVTPYPHIFVIGDAADAFGAIQAGHTAFAQGELAGRNILKLVKEPKTTAGELELYTPGPPAIKVSLGLAAATWPYFGIKVEKDEDMYE